MISLASVELVLDDVTYVFEHDAKEVEVHKCVLDDTNSKVLPIGEARVLYKKLRSLGYKRVE